MPCAQAAIATVQQFLTTGEGSADAFEVLAESTRLGLWHKDQPANRAVAATTLVNLAATLPNVE
jgi:hypothetical protein